MNTTRCLIVDDEEPARRELRTLLSAHPHIEVAGEAADVDAAFALNERLKPDLVFLDIKLAGETGFDFVARLPDEGLPRIVFVTAFDQHALRAFECNALDYLLKPVNPARLAATLRRVGPPLRGAGQARTDDSVFVKSGAFARFVRWAEIGHVESEGNYTRLHLADGKSVVVLRSLKEWLEAAPDGMFVQVHRTLLVQWTAVQGVRQVAEDRRVLLLAGGRELPVGRSYWPAVRELLR